MLRRQYVSKVIKETVGLIRFLPDTDVPIGLVSDKDAAREFREAHNYVSDEKWQEMGQFVYDFTFCFGAVYHDYFNGEIHSSVEEVASDIIEEIIKLRYPTKYMIILHDTQCKSYIRSAADAFKKTLRPGCFKPWWYHLNGLRGFISLIRRNHGERLNPAGEFGFMFGHWLVNLIEYRLAELEQNDEFIPLRLDLNREDGESEDGESLDNNVSEEEDIPDYLVTLRNASINRRKNMKRGLECSIVILIVILLTAYLSTASLNPLAIYATNNLLVKIFVSILVGLLILILAGLLISQFGQMLSKYMMRKSVEVGTGRSADSAICPSCGTSVLLNNDTLGLPIVCHTCHVAWHDGPKCYRKGVPPSNAFLPSYPCPNCRPSTPSD